MVVGTRVLLTQNGVRMGYGEGITGFGCAKGEVGSPREGFGCTHGL